MLVSEAYARNLIFRWLLLPQWNNFPSNTITTATTIRPWKCVSIQLPGWWGSWIPFFLSFKDWLQIKAYFYFCFLKTGETAVPTRNRNLIHLKKKKKSLQRKQDFETEPFFVTSLAYFKEIRLVVEHFKILSALYSVTHLNVAHLLHIFQIKNIILQNL